MEALRLALSEINVSHLAQKKNNCCYCYHKIQQKSEEMV